MLLKYILFALVVGVILKFIPDLQMSDNEILIIVASSTLILLVFDTMTRKEGFDADLSQGIIFEPPCNEPLKIPRHYTFGHREEDYGKTGLTYDNNQPGNPLLHESQFDDVMTNDEIETAVERQSQSALGNTNLNNIVPDKKGPGYYLANNGEFSDRVPLDKVDDLIRASKLEQLWEQHNHNIVWSPHTHFGKARGYLNWDPVY